MFQAFKVHKLVEKDVLAETQATQYESGIRQALLAVTPVRVLENLEHF